MAGKSLDDLKLDDAPLPVATDPRREPWYQFVQDIENLLAQGTVTFAEDTLRSIQVTVERTHWVTDGQWRAVSNIERSAHRVRGGWNRRYEGHGR